MTDLSVDASLLARERGAAPNVNGWVVILASAVLGAGAIALAEGYGWRQGALFVLGGALGIVLYHALFGFTSAWRVFIANGRGAGLRAQMVMLAVSRRAVLRPWRMARCSANRSTVNTARLAFQFWSAPSCSDWGMQLGGGCASGTLYTAGGGNTRMLVTLAFFIIGLGGRRVGICRGGRQLPNQSGSISLIKTLGLAACPLALSLVGFAAIAVLTTSIERRWHGDLRVRHGDRREGWRRFLHGPWPLLAGAVALALGNFATL